MRTYKALTIKLNFNSYQHIIQSKEMIKLMQKYMSLQFYLEFVMVWFDFKLTVKAAPHECAIRTGQP